jgi:hypothetical protein
MTSCRGETDVARVPDESRRHARVDRFLHGTDPLGPWPSRSNPLPRADGVSGSHNPYVKAARGQFDVVQTLVRLSAEKIGEELYAFKPTPEVRSLGEALGQIAGASTFLCSVAAGTQNVADVLKHPGAFQVDDTKASKAEGIAALKKSRESCESVFDSLTDAEANGLDIGDLARVGTLRQSRHLHAAEGNRSSLDRTQVSVMLDALPDDPGLAIKGIGAPGISRRRCGTCT